MNLYHLRYFVTLAHLEHYTKAADVLAITQPSLSHAISSLEEELGVKLFEKNGRNVSLTKYGKTFLGDVEETLNRLDSSVNGLQLAEKEKGKLMWLFSGPLELILCRRSSAIFSPPTKENRSISICSVTRFLPAISLPG